MQKEKAEEGAAKNAVPPSADGVIHEKIAMEKKKALAYNK